MRALRNIARESLYTHSVLAHAAPNRPSVVPPPPPLRLPKVWMSFCSAREPRLLLLNDVISVGKVEDRILGDRSCPPPYGFSRIGEILVVVDDLRLCLPYHFVRSIRVQRVDVPPGRILCPPPHGVVYVVQRLFWVVDERPACTFKGIFPSHGELCFELWPAQRESSTRKMIASTGHSSVGILFYHPPVRLAVRVQRRGSGESFHTQKSFFSSHFPLSVSHLLAHRLQSSFTRCDGKLPDGAWVDNLRRGQGQHVHERHARYARRPLVVAVLPPPSRRLCLFSWRRTRLALSVLQEGKVHADDR